MKQQFDQAHRTQCPVLKASDWVRIRYDRHRRKLQSNWSSPFRIEKQLGPATYRLHDGSRWHANRLRKVPAPTTTPLGDVRLKNKKEDAQLQIKLDHLNFRYRVAFTTLHYETTAVMKEHYNLLCVKGSTHRATADNTMKELQLHKENKETNNHTQISMLSQKPYIYRHPRTVSSKSGYSRNVMSSLSSSRAWSGHSFKTDSKLNVTNDRLSVSRNSRKELHETIQSQLACSRLRPKSTPLLPGGSEVNPVEASIRVFTCRQLRHIATIDSICKKELARQKKNDKQEKERKKLHMEEKLNQKIKEFLNTLKQESLTNMAV
ncbi:UNVERIFIED_CONTAM: hypothetical protein FKN15_042704 [Acipenser sinensis]